MLGLSAGGARPNDSPLRTTFSATAKPWSQTGRRLGQPDAPVNRAVLFPALTGGIGHMSLEVRIFNACSKCTITIP